MTEFSNSRFWRSIAIVLVASLFLIGFGLLERQPVDPAVPARADDRNFAAFDENKPWITSNQAGDTIYVWRFKGTAGYMSGKVELLDSYTFHAK